LQLFEAAYERDEKFGDFFGQLIESADPNAFKDEFLGKIAAINEQEGLKVKWDFDEKAAQWMFEGAVMIHRRERYTNEILDFFADRLKVQQREAGVRHDLIDAVFALGGEDDLVRLLARVHALQRFVETDDGANLLAGYKRAANRLKKEGVEPNAVIPAKAGIHLPTVHPDATPEMDSRLRGNDVVDFPLSYSPEIAEAALIAALAVAQPRAAQAVEAEDFEGAMAALATLRAPIDAFFETVTVNDADPAKRTARLALLAQVRDAVHGVADFSKIAG
jgi:glycyl-tRNA synthetase beta chain